MAYRNFQEQQNAVMMARIDSAQQGVRNGHGRGVQNFQGIGRSQQMTAILEKHYQPMSKFGDNSSNGDSDAPTAVPCGEGTGSDTESSNLSCQGANSPPRSYQSPAQWQCQLHNGANVRTGPGGMGNVAARRPEMNATPQLELAGCSPQDFAAACKGASASWASRGKKTAQKGDNNARPDGRREKGKLKGKVRDGQPPISSVHNQPPHSISERQPPVTNDERQPRVCNLDSHPPVPNFGRQTQAANFDCQPQLRGFGRQLQASNCDQQPPAQPPLPRFIARDSTQVNVQHQQLEVSDCVGYGQSMPLGIFDCPEPLKVALASDSFQTMHMKQGGPATIVWAESL